MAGYVNKAIIVGNLGQDPEVRTFPDGNKVCNLSVATTEKWKNAAGEPQERTEWHRVSVIQRGKSKIIDSFIDPYVKKGNKVYVEGKIETRKWTDKDNNDRYTTEIIVSGPNSNFELLERAPTGGQRVEPNPAESELSPSDLSDDEIPWS